MKLLEREAREGVVIAKTTDDATRGAMIVLNCETDFVAKNEGFINFTESILDKAISGNPDSLEELKKLEIEGKQIAEKVIEQIGIIGEKLTLSYYDKIESHQVIPYIHPGNKLATLVGLSKVVDVQVGRDVAMQIAAMNPVAIDKDDVPPKIIENEKEIGREQARREGRPESILDKIAEGKLNKFFKESTLLNQEYTKDNKKTIRQYLMEIDNELKVTDFRRYSLND